MHDMDDFRYESRIAGVPILAPPVSLMHPFVEFNVGWWWCACVGEGESLSGAWDRGYSSYKT